MSKPGEPVAHIAEDGRLHPLSEHLRKTSELASGFAGAFGCPGWAKLAGLWHDLGKCSADFQRYILASQDDSMHIEAKLGRVVHSSCGALLACDRLGVQGRVLAYLIAGHHAGLPDWQTATSGPSGLAQRLANPRPPGLSMASSLAEAITSYGLPPERPRPGSDPSTWIRMLFSCLVDADFLDTEAFMEPDKSMIRSNYLRLEELLALFSSYMDRKAREVENTEINKLRAEILQQCVSKASEQPSIFSLTVPTGGGKTLSSMAFALNHARKYEKRRIIYVIPYTSIIEQTADQFREIFGDSVIEHHSNVAFAEDDDTANKHKLAAENWDAPVVITTSVQFFESLFASRPSKCRKLHNIINSVVILDEVQLLPPDFLSPILEALKELHRNYGVTFLLSTATQPAFTPQRTVDFSFAGLPGMKEVIDGPELLHDKFRRVSFTIPEDLGKATSWEELAKELEKNPTVLCIVNRRDDCRMLHRLLPKGTIHLSALMCGAHRSEVIANVKKRLRAGVPTRVVSTQLVEAGVDLDFPVVYRALAGLDSIAQAAGRCNREGLLTTKGHVVIFVPPSRIPAGHLRQAGEIGRRLLAKGLDDPLAPEHFTDYFNELYWLRGDRLDAKNILADLAPDSEYRFSFRTAAAKFKMIDDALYAAVFVRYGDGAGLVELLIKKGPERWLLRKLQRYVVNVPRHIAIKLMEAREIEEPFQGIFAQTSRGRYHPELGFCYEGQTMEPDALIT